MILKVEQTISSAIEWWSSRKENEQRSWSVAIENDGIKIGVRRDPTSIMEPGLAGNYNDSLQLEKSVRFHFVAMSIDSHLLVDSRKKRVHSSIVA